MSTSARFNTWPFVVLFVLGLDGQACLGQGGDAEGERNLVKTSVLPRGPGLAASLESDRRIDQHPDVIFAEDFETDDYASRWDDVRNDRGEVLSLVTAESIGPRDSVTKHDRHHRSLRVTSTLGKNTGGGLTKWFDSNDRIFIRFYVRFDPKCDYVHHFCTLRANKAIRGSDAWSGFGGAGVLPEGSERFSTALEPWGNWGRNPAPGQWNFYSYWHQMSASPDGKYWGNAFRPAEQTNIPKDQWICAELMLDHNTPGEADGEQAFWIDGKLIGHWKGISWRKSEQLTANAFTLESYVTDRWTQQATNTVDFDDVVIARQYIGP